MMASLDKAGQWYSNVMYADVMLQLTSKWRDTTRQVIQTAQFWIARNTEAAVSLGHQSTRDPMKALKIKTERETQSPYTATSWVKSVKSKSIYFHKPEDCLAADPSWKLLPQMTKAGLPRRTENERCTNWAARRTKLKMEFLRFSFNFLLLLFFSFEIILKFWLPKEVATLFFMRILSAFWTT